MICLGPTDVRVVVGYQWVGYGYGYQFWVWVRVPSGTKLGTRVRVPGKYGYQGGYGYQKGYMGTGMGMGTYRFCALTVERVMDVH